MKFFKSAPLPQKKQSGARSFGQHRAEQMEKRLQKAQSDQKKLVRASFSATGSTQSAIAAKLDRNTRSIARLKVVDNQNNS